jgi:DNA-directed RNA polymerase specialized sigma24 family protein
MTLEEFYALPEEVRQVLLDSGPCSRKPSKREVVGIPKLVENRQIEIWRSLKKERAPLKDCSENGQFKVDFSDFLESLGPLDREVVLMLADGRSYDEIRAQWSLQYGDLIAAIERARRKYGM